MLHLQFEMNVKRLVVFLWLAAICDLFRMSNAIIQKTISPTKVQHEFNTKNFTFHKIFTETVLRIVSNPKFKPLKPVDLQLAWEVIPAGKLVRKIIFRSLLISKEMTRAMLQLIEKIEPIEITLSICTIMDDAFVDDSFEGTGVKYFYLMGNKMSETALENTLRRLPENTELLYIDKNNRNGNTKLYIVPLTMKRFQNLQSLTMIYNGLTSESSRILEIILELPKLEKLELLGKDIVNIFLARISHKDAIPSLRDSRLKELKFQDLSKASLNSENLASLSIFKYLTSINFGDTYIEGYCEILLLKKNLENLKVLAYGCCKHSLVDGEWKYSDS